MSVVFRDDQYIPIQGQYGSTWRADPTQAGAGALLEHSIHDLDILEWLIGPIRAASAASSEFHAIAGIEDAVSATLRFENEARRFAGVDLARPARAAEPAPRRGLLRAGALLARRRRAGARCTGPDRAAAASSSATDLAVALADAGIELRNPDRAFIEAVRNRRPGHA